MKKLLVVAVAAGLAVVAQASSFKWTMSATGYLYADASTKLSGATVYLINADAGYSQSQLLSYLRGTDEGAGAATRWNSIISGASAKTVAGSSAATTSSGGQFSAQTFNNTAKEVGQYLNAYMVVFQDDGKGNIDLLLSASKSAAYDASAVKSLTFATTGKSAYGDGAYSNAGWYTVASSAAPEPTSAMLMLIGFAGLALRRRRA